MLYDTPPYYDACSCDTCEVCHQGHDWREWEVYPPCDGCLMDLAQWIHENTDFEGCPIPEYCSYRPACNEQYQTEMYGRTA